MNKSTLLKGLFLTALMAISVTACKQNNGGKKEDPDAIKLVEYDPFTGITNHRNMRINGEGAACEQYTEYSRVVENEDGTKSKQTKFLWQG